MCCAFVSCCCEIYVLSLTDNVEAWLLLGKQNLDKMEWVNAQKKFEQILSKTRFDAYSLLGLANLFYCARQEKREKVGSWTANAGVVNVSTG